MSDAETARLAADLAAWLGSQLKAPVQVGGLQRLAGGSSRQNWAFEAEWKGGGGRFVLRRDPKHGIVDTDRRREIAVMCALGGTGIPVPRPRWWDLGGGPLDRPFMILDHVEGSADRRVLTAEDPMELGEAGRVMLARSLCAILAGIHRLDPAALALPADFDDSGASPAAHELEAWAAEVRRADRGERAELRRAEAWLYAHLPPAPAAKRLVHGDFRPANIMVREGAAAWVLDWEFAHIGDPVEDIGWYAALNYASEHFIPGHWGVDAFVAAHEAEAGVAVDRSALRFWTAFASYKLTSMALRALALARPDHTARPEAAVASLIDSVSRATSET